MSQKHSGKASPLVDLSRFVSRALRHAPHEYGLELDAEGWKPMARQNVHLSVDVETAKRVGGRRTRGRHQEPVILRVRAAAAHAAGTPFYRGNDQVWLADAVPAAFIEAMG